MNEDDDYQKSTEHRSYSYRGSGGRKLAGRGDVEFKKARKPGEKRRAYETKTVSGRDGKTNRPTVVTQTEDREKDWYGKIVRDEKTGKIIHECHEPLSKHIGRGTAKKRTPRVTAAKRPE